MDEKSWIQGLNRLVPREDLPITIQGGEPTVHKHFYGIIQGIQETQKLDLLTNLELDEETFIRRVPQTKFKRPSPYASIRVSYHHGQSNFDRLTTKVRKMADKGYSIGIWEVDHPAYHGEVIYRQQVAHSMGIDYRLKEFLGPYGGKNHGTMRYPNAVNDSHLRRCDCKTSELLIAPDGYIFRCHSDLYANRGPIGHLLDPAFNQDSLGLWAPCSVMGKCNSCDIKLKTNRFQEYGHSSVEIRNVSEPYTQNKDYIQEVANTYGKQDATTAKTAKT